MVLRLLEYKQGSDTYANLSAEMTTAAPSSESSQEDGKSEPPLLEIDFESLQAQNPEVVAWLEFPALGLSYPIMHTDNNDYYLHHLWNGQYNASGSLFLAAENESIDDLYTVVYGHNMADGSMFGLLNRYMEESFCKENGAYFRIYTPEAVWRYDIFTAAQVPKDDVVYTFGYMQGTIYDELYAVRHGHRGSAWRYRDDPEHLYGPGQCAADFVRSSGRKITVTGVRNRIFPNFPLVP